MGCPRGNVDDRASRSAVACRHAAHRFACAEHRPDDVDCECLLDRLRRQVLHAREPASDSCIVYEGGDRSQFPFRSLEEREDLIFAGNIGVDCDRTSAAFDNFLRELLRLGLAATEIQRDRVSALTCEPGDRRANAAAGAGDDKGALCFRLSVQEDLLTTN